MKLKLTFVIFLFSIGQLYSQCDIGSVYLSNQTDLENFATQYNSCSKLSGRLEIRSTVNSLSPLSFLKEFEGTLWLAGLSDLSDLSGLDSLKRISGGELRVIANSGLNDFSGLNQLKEIEGNLYIGANNILTSLTGLESLTHISGDLSLAANQETISLEGLNNLVFLGGSINLQGTTINDLQPLSRLTEINGNLTLSTSSIGNLTGLEQVLHIHGTLKMNGTALDDFTGLNNLRTLGALDIGAGNGLKNMRGLTVLDSIYGDFSLSQSDQIDSIVGIENLKYIGGKIDIQSCDKLQDMSGFYSLNYVGGNIQFLQLDALTSLYGLGALKHAERITITQNDLLTKCNIQSLCNFIADNSVPVSFFANSTIGDGCWSAGEIGDRCGSTIDGFDFYSQRELDDFKIEHPQLTRIVGTVNIQGADIVDLSALNLINNIGGPLRIINNPQLADLNGLSGLNQVERSIEIKDAPNLQSIEGLSNLTQISRDLSLSKLPQLSSLSGLRNIKDVPGELFLVNLEAITNLEGLEAIDSVGSDIFLTSCDQLIDISQFNPIIIGKDFYLSDLDKLETIDGFSRLTLVRDNLRFNNNDRLKEIAGFENLTRIIDNLRFYNNDSLTAISGFNQLRQVHTLDITSANALEQITGLTNLETINSNIIFSTTGLRQLLDLSKINACSQLIIRGNNHLKQLPDFSTLSTVNHLRIERNDSLQSLAGLDQLRDIGNNLEITENASLSSLEGLEKLEGIGNNLYIEDNEKLSDCAINAVCNKLNLSPDKVFISDNHIGCNDKGEIDCSLFGFSGRTFFDTNGDKQKSADEVYVPGVKILNATTNEILFTNIEGKWYYPVDTDDTYQFDFYTNQEEWLLSFDTASYTRTFVAGASSNLNLDFGIFPKFPEHKAAIHIWSDLPRCRTVVPFYVDIKNSGAYVDSFLIEMNYNEFVQFDSTTTTLLSLDTTNRTFSWQTPPMNPFTSQRYTFWMQIDNEESIGEYILFNGTAAIDSSGLLTTVEEAFFSTELRCSFDPNDKLVDPLPRPQDSLSLKNNILTYTVRFQNTGNLEAIHVLISDTLDTNLNWETFEVLSSTHRVFTSLSDGGVVTFNFDNIYLPDSTSDLEGSQGQVVYQIRPIDGLADYTAIQNTAYIYFDGNSPVITNTTYNILVDEFPTTATLEAKDHPFRLLPNPASNYLKIETKKNIEQLMIYNIGGTCLKKISSNTSQVDISDLNPGYYLLSIQHEGQLYHTPFVKM